MLSQLTERYPVLCQNEKDIKAATEIIVSCFEKGGKLLLCGNGGSAADCEHISGELMKGFLKKRPLCEKKKAEMKSLCPELEDEITDKLQEGLPAISLAHLTGLNTAFSNDVDAELVYAQSLMALGKKGDVLFCLSTSGNAKNVIAAAKVARGLGISVISLAGKNGGGVKALSDVCICLPKTETYKVQELCLPVYHCICAEIEEHFFKE